MKKITIIAAIIFAVFAASAQVLYNNGATLTLKTGGTMQVNGNAQFQSGGTITNDGTITITGNITNNQTMSAANAGTLTLNGTAAQTLSGSSTYFAKDVIVNNATGFTLNAPLKVDGVFNFNNGIITAATTANSVTFTTNATISNTNKAKDASHINGFVVKEGTSSFLYPVGDGTKYQKVTVDLSANAMGLKVKYNAFDAGAGAFTTGGTEASALVSYNNNEHWDITPLGTATGTVTVFWDGYNDTYSNPAVQRKVAHLTAGNWLNEGTSGTGTVVAGSVISNTISSWSPFTLGTISSTLPLRWLSVTCNINSQKQATIKWQVQETNVAKYSIEKSTDGRIFNTIGNINSNGDGINSYSYLDINTLGEVLYYRIKQIDNDGKFSYSKIISFNTHNSSFNTVYPNPVKDFTTIQVNNNLLNTNATLTDLSGNTFQKINIAQAFTNINLSDYASGIYLLRLQNGEVIKIIKQ